MNPTISQDIIDEAMEADPANAAAEFGAEFRSDVAAYVDRAVVEAAVIAGHFELLPISTVRDFAFVDPSGGSSDSMTLGIAHGEPSGIAVLDVIRERRPPFSPEDVTAEFATLIKSYRCTSVVGDRYAGESPGERMRINGLQYELAEKPQSDIYRDALPALNGGKIELLENARLVSQICSLERRSARGGRDSIDHPPGTNSHDDIANAAWLRFRSSAQVSRCSTLVMKCGAEVRSATGASTQGVVRVGPLMSQRAWRHLARPCPEPRVCRRLP